MEVPLICLQCSSILQYKYQHLKNISWAHNFFRYSHQNWQLMFIFTHKKRFFCFFPNLEEDSQLEISTCTFIHNFSRCSKSSRRNCYPSHQTVSLSVVTICTFPKEYISEQRLMTCFQPQTKPCFKRLLILCLKAIC